MNRLPLYLRKLLLSMLVEGSSMRSISRTLDISFNTVKKMLIEGGAVCAAYHDETVRNVEAQRVECDEMWAFCYAKNKTVAAKGPLSSTEAGDVWTWTAIDPETKLLIAWYVGDRSMESGRAFLEDLRGRLADKVHLTSDQYGVYLEAVSEVFGEDVEHHLLRKSEPEQTGLSSTAHVERHNLTMRMGMRRFTRRTNAFSKRLVRHESMLALYMVHYNFVRVHQSLRMTPAMAAGLTNTLHDIEWLAEMIDERQPQPNRPKTYRKTPQQKPC